MRHPSLRITEIFYSLQGEADTVGWPTVFIRLTGCPLRCVYCDSEYAFHGGQRQSLDAIMGQVDYYAPKRVTVTGGEPLAQPASLTLMRRLCDQGYRVSIETSGALDVSPVDARVKLVLDVKTPASGEHQRNRWANIEHLKADDQAKFVICNEQDYRWSLEIINAYQLTERCHVLMSPSHGVVGNDELAGWILRDRLDVRFQLQLHKYIWGDVPGR